MRYDVGRFRRPMRRSTEGQLMSLISLGDGSTLSLDFTTGQLDPRLTFTRSGTGTFINASGLVATASTNTPRFDYDPTTLAPKGLLIEGSATNLLSRSEEFDNTGSWIAFNRTVTPNDGVAPDGNTTADSIQAVVSGTGGVYHATSVPSGTHTFSIFAKANGANGFTISVDTSSNGRATDFTLTGGGSAGTPYVRGTGGTVTSMTSSVQTFPSGWVRCIVTVVTTGTNSVALYTQSGTSKWLAWGAQLEAGSGASSYIPTGASQATRNADNCYIYDTTSSGGLSWFKTATQGTFYVEMFKRTAGTAFAAAGFGTRATFLQEFMLYQAVGNNWLSFNWGAGEYATNYSALSSPFLIKAAVALSPSTPTTEADSTVSINGSNSALNTGPNIALPFTSDLFCIGSRGLAGGTAPSQNYAETAIRRIKFFPFAMTAAQMNALTTL